ncbi:hypothetical protein [Dokdonella sp.]|uniref:LuxE/PaaK family acyltransferase n=1 Tax=Dokdonella sp. TaxID=2291710 RepID=UPI0031BCD1CC|nr:hypothetical protein [Dokdonella sp.]
MKPIDSPSRPSVPDATRLAGVQALVDRAEPYAHGADADALFVAAMNEIIAWHRDRNPFYARLLAHRGPADGRLRTLDDCVALPGIHANFFKTHEITSIPAEQVALHLTSSGTTGQKSQMFFDAWSIGAGQQMVEKIYRHYGWVTDQPVNYLLFNYEPLADWKVGTSWTSSSLTRFAPASELRYALRRTGSGGHEFDVYGAIRTLQAYAEQGLPVRLFGFPAFVHATLERMQALGLPSLQLAPGSMTFFGGGWKGQADRAIPKAELQARIEAQLGIDNALIRDGFGSVEHSVPYIECPRHRFHVPVWSRVVIRDVATLEPLPAGEAGFLNFLSAYVTSAPSHSVIMGDLAAWYPGDACGCGLAAPWFDLIGRAGQGKNRSCAVAAAELLKGNAA